MTVTQSWVVFVCKLSGKMGKISLFRSGLSHKAKKLGFFSCVRLRLAMCFTFLSFSVLYKSHSQSKWLPQLIKFSCLTTGFNAHKRKAKSLQQCCKIPELLAWHSLTRKFVDVPTLKNEQMQKEVTCAIPWEQISFWSSNACIFGMPNHPVLQRDNICTEHKFMPGHAVQSLFGFILFRTTHTVQVPLPTGTPFAIDWFCGLWQLNTENADTDRVDRFNEPDASLVLCACPFFELHSMFCAHRENRKSFQRRTAVQLTCIALLCVAVHPWNRNDSILMPFSPSTVLWSGFTAVQQHLARNSNLFGPEFAQIFKPRIGQNLPREQCSQIILF